MTALDEMVNPRSGASVGDTFIYSVPAEVARAAPAELARLQAIEEHVNEAVEKITDWKDKAYPLGIFPEPDFERAHELLTAGGMSLDAVSASAIRFALSRVCEILAACLPRQAALEGQTE